MIGGDGAGKSTIAGTILTTEGLDAVSIYMGSSVQSANRLLPTSRLVLWLKRSAYRRRVRGRSESPVPKTERIPAAEYEYASRSRGAVWVAARYINRFLEAWWRQFLALREQLRGRLVIYDRHFLFDDSILDAAADRADRPLPERIFRAAMRRTYPRPDLVVFLHAPGDVLVARKGEASAQYHDLQAERYRRQSDAVPRFVQIDASRPLDVVTREVLDHVAALRRGAR